MSSDPRMMPGYAFLLVDQGPSDAFVCNDDYWEIVVAGDDVVAGARHLGKRSIDGTRCDVWIVGEGTADMSVYAQTVAGAGQSSRRT